MYDCDVCRRTKEIDRRTCYFEDDENKVIVPIYTGEEEGKAYISVFPSEQREILLTLDEFVEYVYNIVRYNPELAPVDIVHQVINLRYNTKKPICLTALWTPFIQYLIDLESATKEYGVLPFPGGLLEQPQFIITAFEVIRKAKNMYEAEFHRKNTPKSKPPNG